MSPAADPRHAVVPTTLGPLSVVVDDVGLAGLYFPGHWTRPDPAAWGPRVEVSDDVAFADVVAQLHEYLGGGRTAFDLPLHLVGTPAALRAWERLRAIPRGTTTSYGALAAELGTSARAVGGYVGRNPVSIVVPCHRVVGSTGRLTGYAGGLARKQHLLELEGVR